MPTIHKKLKLNTTAVDVGCGSGCRRINLSKIFNPKPNKYKRNHTHYYPDNHRRHHSWNTTPTTTTATTFSPNTSDYTTVDESEVRSLRAVQGFGRIGGNSLAVEKDSDDPYVDFRESMLQMIMEKEIYGREDLRELLNCFLQLNSPYYHGIIIRAFTEIWNNVLSFKLMHGDQSMYT
ncbi:transcription repressor OFP6-like [Cynara cardunculus var. scolymus]|uniref:Transcription repressor n=1 Tax=Cynara cardunculus var. scolymus TaxID=59895 RepID=A0A103XH14_CYNCS|nr:transcription repressor OFP6-like [Cynara cardunculus var. scolymus]KVH90613.1 Ovate protein family, C-terminal [Cynara cardunculus var. scolymus]